MWAVHSIIHVQPSAYLTSLYDLLAIPTAWYVQAVIVLSRRWVAVFGKCKGRATRPILGPSISEDLW